MVRSGRQLLVPDASKSKKWNSQAVVQKGLVAYLGIPIYLPNGAVFGTLCVYSNHAGSFTPTVEKLCARLANTIEINLHHLVLTQNLQAEIVARSQAEERYRMLADNSSDMIWVADAATRTHEYISPASQKLWGYTPEEIQGQSALSCLSPKSRAEMARNFDRLDQIRHEHLPVIQIEPVEVELVHKDGHIVYTEASIRLIVDEQGQRIRVLGVSRNITRRKQAENALRIREQELMVAKEAAEQANRAKSLFLANMSHEIRTPLSALVGLSQVMVLQSERRKLPKDFVRTLAQIRSGGHYLNVMLTNLLDVSAIEGGRPRLHMRPIDLTEWARGVRDILEPIATARGVKLLWHDTPLEPAEVNTDPVRLAQILINLVHNAVKFTPPGKHVRVSFRRRPGYFAMEIRDEGPGLPPEQQDPFTPFSPGLPAISDLDHGIGLGLYVVKNNVHLLDGTVHAANSSEGGACFCVQWNLNESEPKHARGHH